MKKTITEGLFVLFLLLCAQLLIAQSGEFACPPCNSHCDTLTFSEEGSCEHCGMALVPKESIKSDPKKEKLKIAFYLQNGVEILDFAGPLEVFSYAGFEVFTVARTSAPIISQGVLKVVPDYSIENAPQADILAFFGGNSSIASKDTAVIDWIRQQQTIQYHFSVCTGAFMLAEAGVLDGKTATTFHNALDALSEYKKITVRRDVRFVDNGKVISTAGISAGIDGALHLVAKLKGFNAARRVAYHMEYDKWVPAEGLLLCNDNPYELLGKSEALKKYEGMYEYLKGQKIKIAFNEREKSLEAIFEGQKYPLFYETESGFLTIEGVAIRFEFSEVGKLVGYKIEGERKLFNRIN